MSRVLEHTPLPWAVGIASERDELDYSDVRIVQDINDDMRVAFLANDGTQANRTGRANACLIVRACNSHHELIEALRWALGRLNDARAVCYGGVTVEQIEERQRVLAMAEGR